MAHPDKAVVSVNGDGGFMYTMPEIATAVHHSINLVAIVFVDGAFGNVLRMQRDLHDNRIIASEFTNPNFVKLAESFGAKGMRATNPEELSTAIEEGFSANKPTIIEVPVGVFQNPSTLYAHQQLEERKVNMRENALIIGAGLGLSASLARLLTKNNFNVAIAARNIEKLENLKIETNSKVFQCDASNIEDVENLFIQSDKLLGAPNLVIYNPSARVRGGIAGLIQSKHRKQST